MKFWESYFKFFEPRDRSEDGISALWTLALLIPTFIVWSLWQIIAWIARLGRRSS